MKEIKGYIYNLTRMFSFLFKLAPRLFILVVFISVLDAVLPYINIIAMQLMIDGLTDKEPVSTMVNIVFAAIMINIVIRIISGGMRKRREVLEAGLELKFDKNLSLHVLRLSLVDLESTKVKELKRNIEQAKMRNGGVEHVVYDFETVVRNIMSLITSSIVLVHIFMGQKNIGNMSFWTSPYPVVILVVIVIICTLITFRLQSAQNLKVSNLNDQVNQANGSAFAYMQFISNYHFGKDIRIYELGDYLCDFFDNLWKSSIGYKLTQKLGKEKAKIPCITVICNEVINIFIYILAIGKAYAKEITVGNVVVYIRSIQAFLQSMIELIGTSSVIIGHGALMKPFLELLDMEEEQLSGEIGQVPLNFNEISFEHVYFRYPGQENWVLEDLSFTLKRDQKMALVGENGAGKSTIIKLICRLYEPNEGSIKIDGVDIRLFDKRHFWNMLGVVFQDFSLPALSLGNVISGKDSYDEGKVRMILHKVGMESWLSKLNITFDQCVYNDFSDSGIEISGGESQKIAIARAIFKEAPFMILDEPTAALDTISEASIFRDFHEICKDKTCIIISHRLYSCRICDFILVLHKGRLAQQGTHEELLCYGGKYKEMWDSQAGLYSEVIK